MACDELGEATTEVMGPSMHKHRSPTPRYSTPADPCKQWMTLALSAVSID